MNVIENKDAAQNTLGVGQSNVLQERRESPFSNPSTHQIALEMAASRTQVRKDNREFVCGFGAALINISVTFPMNKLMFRQMLHGISSKQAWMQLHREGLKSLYRGILPPMCQKTISTSIMFGMYEQYTRLLESHFSYLPKGATLAIAATLAGCTEAILCPFERIQTVLQDQASHRTYKNSIHCAREMRRFGLTEYYRGFSLILLRNGPSNVLFFGLRKEIKAYFPEYNDWYQIFLVDFVSGAFLGAFISTLMYPINVVKAHNQCQVGGPFLSNYSTFNDVYKSRGRKLRGLFRGVHVNYTRALFSWGIINASYEVLLKVFYN